MAKKKKSISFKNQCTITGDVFRSGRKAPNPTELVSVRAYYELHSEEDDRPEYIKAQAEVLYQEEKERQRLAEERARQMMQENGGVGGDE